MLQSIKVACGRRLALGVVLYIWQGSKTNTREIWIPPWSDDIPLVVIFSDLKHNFFPSSILVVFHHKNYPFLCKRMVCFGALTSKIKQVGSGFCGILSPDLIFFNYVIQNCCQPLQNKICWFQMHIFLFMFIWLPNIGHFI